MLLVDDGEGEVREPDAFLHQRVGADEEVDRPVGHGPHDDVAVGDHADGPAVVDHRHNAGVLVAHDPRGILDAVFCSHGAWVRRHHVAYMHGLLLVPFRLKAEATVLGGSHSARRKPRLLACCSCFRCSVASGFSRKPHTLFGTSA